MSTKPTFVLVPGGWHRALVYDKLRAELSKHEYKSIAVTLPSTLGDNTKSFIDDLIAVREAILSETNQGHNVIVVGHSYGGIPAQSAIKGLARPSDVPTSTTGYVIGLALIASGFVVPAPSFLAGIGGTPPPFWRANTETGFAELTPGFDVRDLFYSDLPVAEGEHYVSELAPQSLKALTEGGEHFYTAWVDVPSWILQTTEDHSFPLAVQEMTVAGTRAAGGRVTARQIASSHSPFLSKPEETARFLVDAAVDFGA